MYVATNWWGPLWFLRISWIEIVCGTTFSVAPSCSGFCRALCCCPIRPTISFSSRASSISLAMSWHWGSWSGLISCCSATGSSCYVFPRPPANDRWSVAQSPCHTFDRRSSIEMTILTSFCSVYSRSIACVWSDPVPTATAFAIPRLVRSRLCAAQWPASRSVVVAGVALYP